jgi:hypothetical protein
MKASKLIEILSKHPDYDVMIATKSIIVENIVNTKDSIYYNLIDGIMVGKASINLYPESYKLVETKGVDF